MGIIIFVAFLPEKVQLFVLFLGSQEAGMFRKELTEARLSAHEPLHSPLVPVRPAAQHLRWWLQFDKAWRVWSSGESPEGETAGPAGLSSRPLIAVSHHAIDPPGSFRCLHRFHNSLIPANLRDKLRGVESVNGAPWFWNPVAGSFFYQPRIIYSRYPPPECWLIITIVCICVFVFWHVCGGYTGGHYSFTDKNGIFEFSVLRYLTW